MAIEYAQLSISQIRDSRANDQSENHLYKLLHRGYTGTIDAKEDRYGEPKCQYSFFQNWVNDPKGTQEHVESFTRKEPGVKCAPIKGIPFE